METVTTILLIAVTLIIGLFLFVKGIRGAVKSWKGEAGEKAIKSLADKKLLTEEEWINKDLEKDNVPLWLFFVMLDRISK